MFPSDFVFQIHWVVARRCKSPGLPLKDWALLLRVATDESGRDGAIVKKKPWKSPLDPWHVKHCAARHCSIASIHLSTLRWCFKKRFCSCMVYNQLWFIIIYVNYSTNYNLQCSTARSDRCRLVSQPWRFRLSCWCMLMYHMMDLYHMTQLLSPLNRALIPWTQSACSNWFDVGQCGPIPPSFCKSHSPTPYRV